MTESERPNFREEFRAALDAVGKMFERSRPGRGAEQVRPKERREYLEGGRPNGKGGPAWKDYWFYDCYGGENHYPDWDDRRGAKYSQKEVHALVALIERGYDPEAERTANPQALARKIRMAHEILRAMEMNDVCSYGLATVGEADEDIEEWGVKKSRVINACVPFLSKETVLGREEVTPDGISFRGSELEQFELGKMLDEWEYVFLPRVDTPKMQENVRIDIQGNPDRNPKWLIVCKAAMIATEDIREDPYGPGQIYREKVYMSPLIRNADLQDQRRGSPYWVPDRVIAKRLAQMRKLGAADFDPLQGRYKRVGVYESIPSGPYFSQDAGEIAKEHGLAPEDAEDVSQVMQMYGQPMGQLAARSWIVRVMLMGGETKARYGRPVYNEKTGKWTKVTFPTLNLWEYMLLHPKYQAAEPELEDPGSEGGGFVTGWLNQYIGKAYNSRKTELAEMLSPGTSYRCVDDIKMREQKAGAKLSTLDFSRLRQWSGDLRYHYKGSAGLWHKRNLMDSAFCESRAVELHRLPTRYEVKENVAGFLSRRVYGHELLTGSDEIAQLTYLVKVRGSEMVKGIMAAVTSLDLGVDFFRRVFRQVGEGLDTSWEKTAARKRFAINEKDATRSLAGLYLLYMNRDWLGAAFKLSGAAFDARKLVVGSPGEPESSWRYRYQKARERVGLERDYIPVGRWSKNHFYNLFIYLSTTPRPQEQGNAVNDREVMNKLRPTYWERGIEAIDDDEFFYNLGLTKNEADYVMDPENQARLLAMLDRERDLVYLPGVVGPQLMERARNNVVGSLDPLTGLSNRELYQLAHLISNFGKRDKHRLVDVQGKPIFPVTVKGAPDFVKFGNIDELRWVAKEYSSELTEVVIEPGATGILGRVMANRFMGRDDNNGFSAADQSQWKLFEEEAKLMGLVLTDEYFKMQVYGPEWGAGEEWDQESINLVFPRLYALHYDEFDRVLKHSIYQQLGLYGKPTAKGINWVVAGLGAYRAWYMMREKMGEMRYMYGNGEFEFKVDEKTGEVRFSSENFLGQAVTKHKEGDTWYACGDPFQQISVGDPFTFAVDKRQDLPVTWSWEDRLGIFIESLFRYDVNFVDRRYNNGVIPPWVRRSRGATPLEMSATDADLWVRRQGVLQLASDLLGIGLVEPAKMLTNYVLLVPVGEKDRHFHYVDGELRVKPWSRLLVEVLGNPTVYRAAMGILSIFDRQEKKVVGDEAIRGILGEGLTILPMAEEIGGKLISGQRLNIITSSLPGFGFSVLTGIGFGLAAGPIAGILIGGVSLVPWVAFWRGLGGWAESNGVVRDFSMNVEAITKILEANSDRLPTGRK